MARQMDFHALDERMQWYVDQQILGCVATMVLDGVDIVHEARHGYLSVEDERELTDDAIFRMFSNTKLVTSVALMMLFEEGKFALDDPLHAHLHAFAGVQVLKPDAASIVDAEHGLRPRLRAEDRAH